MMKIKIAEATPLQIDYLVAKVEGVNAWVSPTGFLCYSDKSIPTGPNGRHFNPTANPAQGQPILERERISFRVRTTQGFDWKAFKDRGGSCNQVSCVATGPTMLIAGLRAFLVSRLGEEAEVPEELV